MNVPGTEEIKELLTSTCIDCAHQFGNRPEWWVLGEERKTVIRCQNSQIIPFFPNEGHWVSLYPPDHGLTFTVGRVRDAKWAYVVSNLHTEF